jgi:hypothetical protein
MNLYLLTQEVNNAYDTYDSCVVCAKGLNDAKTIHPSEQVCITKESQDTYDAWCKLSDVKVKYIGQAKRGLKRGVILSSFNAG